MGEDFEVGYTTEIPDKEVTVFTSTSEKWLSEAMEKYDPTNRQYSTYLNADSSSTDISQSVLDNLAKNPQDDLAKVKQINSIVKYFINSDDIIGKVDETIETNVNTEYKMVYGSIDGRNKTRQKKEVELFIDKINDLLDIGGVIRMAIPKTYREGTYVMYLRHDKEDYVIDTFPLGVAVISNYKIGSNDPFVMIDMEVLKSKLSKSYDKNKKKKPLFFKDIEEEIKATYPKEVYDAYKNKEQYAILDIRYTFVMRVGNLGDGKYGVTPIFRALSSALMLKTFEDADRVTSKSRAKKIIVQLLNKEMSGADYQKDKFDLTAWCHDNLLSAFKNKTVIVTGNPAVRDIKYVESNTDLTNVDTVNEYRGKEMSSLGIGFLMDSGSQSISTANISVDQLLKTINKISEQLETGLNKFYRQILQDNNYDLTYCPKIQIIDSEQVEMSMKMELATFLYNTLNCSRRTAYETLGVNVEDEASKRKYENENNYDELFSPHITGYTASGNTSENTGGRPANSENKDKQGYDKQRNELNE